MTWMLLIGCLMAGACKRDTSEQELPSGNAEPAGERRQERTVVDWPEERALMMEQLEAYGVADQRVLDAMAKVRRHLYIPAEYRMQRSAYADQPCPIGHGQTISQPFIVAYMTERMKIRSGEKVLEIGTGSGYQTAILAEMGAQVYSIEIVAALAEHAGRALAAEGYSKVRLRTGDGYQGWPEHAPFDVIIVTCAPAEIPPVLIEQLAEGGRMILPLGTKNQNLVTLRKSKGQVHRELDMPVRFVPMVRGG